MKYTIQENSNDENSRILALLDEYENKLVKIRNDLILLCSNSDNKNALSNNYNNEAEFIAKRKKYLMESYKNFEPSLERFARSVSQLIDHGNVSPIIEIEMSLRLASFEMELQLNNKIFHNIKINYWL